MLVYRVFPYDLSADHGEPGHPDYIHWPAQGGSRLDNPGHYAAWYYGATPEAAIGESFANYRRWSDGMFEMGSVGRKVLGIYKIDDDPAVVDLDDANNLLTWGLRPTQVIARNRPATQDWALRIFRATTHDGSRKWNGVHWWSFHRPQWRVYGLWHTEAEPVPHRFVEAEELNRDNQWVRSVEETLDKDWLPGG